jgi:hypothetical protein
MRRLLLFIITAMLCLGSLSLATCGPAPTATYVALLPTNTVMPTATATVAPTLTLTPTYTPTPTDTATPAATPEPCNFVVLEDIIAPRAPRAGADDFEALGPGYADEAVARTADGWLGFEPGIPQSHNVGIFRLLWLDPAASVDYTGGCDQLPIVTHPFGPLCAAVPIYDTESIYAGPDGSFEPIAELDKFGWIEVIDWPLTDWWRVDLANSSLGANGYGWLRVDRVDLMFYHCQDLHEPDPNACLAYVDGQMEVTIYASPSLDAERVHMLGPGDFALVLPSQEEGRLYVDLGSGNVGLNLTGWVDARDVGLYGSCP